MDPTRATVNPVARAFAADVSRRDVAVLLGAGGLAALLLAAGQRPMGAAAQDATPASGNPSAGERGHFDLAVHLPWDPAAIAHHWCKPCLLYTSPSPRDS